MILLHPNKKGESQGENGHDRAAMHSEADQAFKMHACARCVFVEKHSKCPPNTFFLKAEEWNVDINEGMLTRKEIRNGGM